MTALRPIDPDTWVRREHFEHYLRRVPCTYAVTVDVDATEFVAALGASTKKTYLAQIWTIASVVNRHDEFRMSVTESGQAAIWDTVDPAFTVFNPERETFAAVWTPFDPDFGTFHERAAVLLAEARSATTFLPQGELPRHCFDISSLPWLPFTGFTLQISGGESHLLPIFTVGRHVDRDGRTFLPLAVQVHHAAADGFHTSRLVRELQELLADPSWLD